MEDSIISDLKESYGITFNQITPVTGGLLNLKWKVSTEKGELLVKQYSTKRFGREKIERIESALQRQIILEKNGVPCPLLWQHRGRVIRWLDDKDSLYGHGFSLRKDRKCQYNHNNPNAKPWQRLRCDA